MPLRLFMVPVKNVNAAEAERNAFLRAQPDASSAMTHGPYALTGGFWVLPQAVQMPGAPTLTIAPAAPGTATVSWTPNIEGFVLQETWNLSPANWTDAPSDAAHPMVVPATAQHT